MGYNLSQEAVSFFMHSYFGITLKELEERDCDKIIMKCAQRAYLDLNRTLRFAENTTNNKLSAVEKQRIEKEHQKFRDDICIVIKEQISKSLLGSDKTNFDDNHKKACCEICAKANKSETLSEVEENKDNPNGINQRFYYGQAQKWLNMTMKYMWLIGLWKDEFDRLLPMLHIPVDSFIIEAIWHENFEEDGRGRIKDEDVNRLLVELPCEKKKRKCKYADDKTVSWSKWNDSEYNDFQRSLRAWCKDEAPILWECRAWIDIANKRSSL